MPAMARSTSASFQSSPSVKRSIAKMQRALKMMGVAVQVRGRDGAVLGGHGLSFDGEVIEVRGAELPPVPVRAYLRGMAPRRTVLWFRWERTPGQGILSDDA